MAKLEGYKSRWLVQPLSYIS